MADIIDSQPVPADWPRAILTRIGNTFGVRTPPSPNDQLSYELNDKIPGDHVVFEMNARFYYIDDPAAMKQVAQVTASPQYEQEKRRQELKTIPSYEQQSSMQKDEDKLRAEIAGASSPDLRANLMRQEGLLAARRQSFLAEEISSLEEQGRKVAWDAQKQGVFVSETPAKMASEYGRLRSLLDDSMRKGLAKPADDLVAAAKAEEATRPPSRALERVTAAGS